MTSDHAHRPHKLWSTRLTSTKKDDDKCLFTEDNESLELDLVKSSSKKFLFVQSCGRDSTRNLAVPLTSLDNSEKKLQLVQPMKENVLYSTYHVSSTCGEDGDNSKNDYDEFWLVTNEDGATNSKIVSMKIKNNDMSSKCGDNSLVFHDPKVKIDHLVCFSTHVVVFCRKNGFSTFFTISLAASAGREVKEVQWSDQVYSVKNVETNSENWDGDFIRVVYSTLSSPPVTLDYFFSTGEKKICSKELKKPGGSLNLDEKMEEKKKDEKMEKKESLYETKRLCVDVCDKDDNDGKDPSSRRSQRSQRSVPMSMVYRKDLFKSDGKNKCILYGYGSYGLSVEPEYDSNRLSLLDRGIVFIIAHIRGGGEMGKDWHHEGRMLKKKNTFTDFIACAEELIKLGITSPENLAISGGSAGGLLMAVVLNMRPELFRTCLCRVPYVDAIVTMADPSIPLVVPEWKEFGNTNEQDVYDYVIQYSPIENVASAFKKAEPKLKQIALEKVEVNDELKDGFGSAFHFDRKVGKYPSMLVTTSLQDSMVAYWEPTKWVSTLRHNIPYYSAGRDDASHDDKKEEKNNNSGGRNGSMLLLKTKMQNAGHGGSSGKYSALADKATEFSFLLTELDVSV
jgi:oligopeptidase B